MSWFWTPRPRPDAAIRLFCFPYAGAGASAFRRWPAALGAGVEMRAVQLPGRESRIAEPPEVDPPELASALAKQLAGAEPGRRRYALFGHSMGGRLAFEVVRALRELAAPLPERLYVSGCRPPDIAGAGILDGLSKLDDGALVDRLRADGHLPAAVAAEPELLELLLPVFRADFGWLDGYRFRPQPPLPVPVTGFAGSDDRAVPAAQMPGWQRHTSAGYRQHTLPGGHFFLHERLADLAAVIRADTAVGNGAVGNGAGAA